MAMNNLYMLGALGAAGALGGGIYLAYPSSTDKPASTTTIRDKLVKDSYTILNDGHSDWSKVLEKYNDTKITPDRRFTQSTETIELDVLKRSCESALSHGEDESLYEKTKLWCTVPRTLQQRLEDLKIKLLRTDGNDDQDKWGKLKDLYKAAGDKGIKTFAINNPDDTNAWQQLRDECKKHLNKERWDSEYEYYLGKVSDWCSDKG
ncbi:hypothetical protein HF1_10080 [Mycoplasma haemofelis str. Langford 1]|uniref:Uncharacterized protein n=2 Tax=Mycoplasma haemofelis TaxID=29501 RepID=F6FJJ0_MYCHI|nr:hypothetical protein [Mycoplasma haemofelis]AEG73345.1 hypothetical protein MHF_1097 [Mycoplasma haemofelis Ohio2]CBY93016.1 hypothetical protein HF1_10080 [Mycoplasma haemofelis str. Langford 1]